MKQTCKKLIISAGDISDVDGFMALTEYFRTGADVLFVMNYPAYVGCKENSGERNVGMGFEFTATQVLEHTAKDNKKYSDFMRQYEQVKDDNERMKKALTDLAFEIVTALHKEDASGRKGGVFFSIGGVNAVNPFSSADVKDEVLLFSEFLPPRPAMLEATENKCFDQEGKECCIAWGSYSSIYMDFNGSMAHMRPDGPLSSTIRANIDKLEAAFIMGGVLSDAPAQTMPSIPGKLNRLSAATMNQLYHPAGTANFLTLLAERRIPAYIVANNAVHDLSTADDNKTKTFRGVESFLSENLTPSAYLGRLAQAYYLTPHYSQPPRKAFDVYTAAALREYIAGRRLRAAPRLLYFCGTTGVSLVAPDPVAGGGDGGWAGARDSYLAGVDMADHEGDSDFVVVKKASFRREAQVSL